MALRQNPRLKHDVAHLAVVTMSAFAFASSASAMTLGDALAEAYRSNPTLLGQREQLAAINEEYVVSKSALRPQLSVQASLTNQNIQSSTIFGRHATVDNSAAFALNITQPLYTAGRVTGNIRAAEADIFAARESLRTSEANVLLSVIQAYLDVLRDQRILATRLQEQIVLENQLDDAKQRFSAREITRTDVEQSRAQLQSSRSQISLSRGQLEISRAAFRSVVGLEPDKLADPSALPGLPESIEQAFEIAERDNAELQRSRFVERAAIARVAEAKSQTGPNLSLQGAYGYSGLADPFYANKYNHNFSIGLVFNQVLVDGGAGRSNVRKAQATAAADRLTIEATRRQVVAQTSQFFAQVGASQQSEREDYEDEATAQLYFDDTVMEYKIGQRSTLDVLIAEQTLRAAQIAKIQAQHDGAVASASLLMAIGRLNASALFQTMPNDVVNRAFQRVRTKGAVPWEGVIEALDGVFAPRLERSFEREGAPSPADPKPALKAGTSCCELSAPERSLPLAPVPSHTKPDAEANPAHNDR